MRGGKVVGIGGKAVALVSRSINEYPVRVAFLGSLLLSLIAVMGLVTIGRDAAFYMTIAQGVTEQGPKLAFQSFDWPWFTLLIAGTHVVLPLPFETIAHLWCAFLLAGTCALVVDCVRQRTPEAARWACLVVLAMPAVNQDRDDILREFGFWFFCTLTLWLALRWQARGGWLRAASMHMAIVAALLFRLEAVLLWAALGLWQLPNLWSSERRKQFLQFALLPMLGLILAVAVLSMKGGLSSVRVQAYLDMINPRNVFASFNLLSQQFANTLSHTYSRSDAGQIIFFGLLATVAILFVKMMGVFGASFLYRGSWGVLGIYWRQYRPFVWAALLYCVVLMLFFIKQQFMIGRYVSFLNLLFVPALAMALVVFARRFPRLGKVVLVIGLLLALSNVITIGAKKTQYIEAGHWVAANMEPGASAYYDDGRISYYAGRGYVYPTVTREEAMSAEQAERYRYFLIEAKGDEPWLSDWLVGREMRIIARFANRKGATVLVIGK
ncbi:MULTISPECIES: hypothetical protein [unclassified Pseudomonas]|uniref:hypothetical protein n=1 Tax=unclassified Pseudomonas TaxID=196821 RepID=UPI00200EE64C|nr:MULTISPECIES: hypothetical protein [unclassified Pseudomonas]